MPVPEEKVLNTEKFRKAVALFDSSNAGESGNAIRAALRQCEAADISFIDALQMTFGEENGELTAARERITKLEAEAESLAQKVLEFQDANSELQNEIDRLNAEQVNAVEDATPERGGSSWFSPWEVTGRRLLLMGAGLLVLNLLMVSLNWHSDFGGLVAMVVMAIDAAFGVWLVAVGGIRLFYFLRRWAAR